MAITTAMCTTFKKEILEAVHNFKNTGGSTFNLALYTSSASWAQALRRTPHRMKYQALATLPRVHL